MTSFFGLSIDPSDYPSCVEPERLRRSLEVMKPKPSPFPLIRFGGSSDGAYLVPDDLAGLSDCFSPGSNGIKQFEDQLALRYGMRSHIIDASCREEDFKTPLLGSLQDFKPLWLDSFCSENRVTLASWLEMVLPPPSHDCLLQMDIEGAEYRTILATDDHVLSRFRIIVIELHEVPVALQTPELFFAVVEPFLVKLGRQFTCVHAHPNNYYRDVLIPGTSVRVPRLIELVLLRNDRLASKGPARARPIELPHRLDILNVSDRPPLFLDDFWSSRTSSVATRLKMASLWLAYLRAKALRRLRRLFRRSQR